MSGLLGGGSTPTNAPIIYSGLSVSTSQWNLPIALFWGTRRLSPNAMAYTNFQKHSANGKGGGGKGGGGKGGQNYTYTADCLLGLCEGPLDGPPQNIWANGSTTTTTTLSALNMTFFAGTLGQAPWSYWSTNYPAQALAYSQTAYLGAPNLNLGESASIPDYGFECVRTSMLGYVRTGTMAGWINPNSHAQSTASDVLISDVVTDLLTNPQYSMGWSAADLGPISQFAAYNRAQGLFVSPLLNSQEKATEVLNRWAQITNSWIFWSGTRLEFLPLGDVQVTGNGVTFVPQNDVAYALQLGDLIAGKNEPPVKITRKDPADCYNRTSVNICDRTLGYIDNPIAWTDDTLIDQYGLRDNTSVSADEVCDPAVGAIVAQLVGKRAAYIRLTYQFKTSYRFILCLPGTVLTIPLNMTGLFVRVRVTGVQQDDKGQLSFDAEEFPGTVGTYIAPLAAPTIALSGVPNAFAPPPNINTPAIIEPPASYTGGTAKVIAAASGEGAWGGCDVWLGFDGTDYRKVGTITAPAAQGLLTAPLAAFTGTGPDTTNTLSIDATQSGTPPQPVTQADAQMLRTLSLVAPQPVVSGGVAQVPSDGELLAFGNVAVTGTYAANLTYLERGVYGTSSGEHAVGEQFTLIDPLGTTGTSVAFDLPTAYIGQTLYLKFASFNQFGQAAQDLSECVEYQYVPVGAGGAGASRQIVRSDNAAPVSSTSNSITVAAFNGVLDDGQTVAFPDATLSGLQSGVTYLVFYALQNADQPLLGADGTPILGASDQPLTTTVMAGSYIAVPAPALKTAADSRFALVRDYATANSNGSYPPVTPTSAGDGGTGTGGGGRNQSTITNLD